MFHRPDRVAEPLYVITPVFNPVRFRSRWKLYGEFAKRVVDAGAVLYTIEAAFGARTFALADVAPQHTSAVAHTPQNSAVMATDCRHDATHRGRHQYLQVRTSHELWLKEAMINLAARHLPHDWKYVAWIDADVLFARPDWVGETLHRLQHYPVVQMWSELHDLNDTYQLVGSVRSFAAYWREHGRYTDSVEFKRDGLAAGYDYAGMPGKRRYPGAPGLAWAMRREAWDQLGGLIDFCILGSCDWFMAHCLTGQVDAVLKRGYHPRYAARIREWQTRAAEARWAERPIAGNIGVLDGVALHFWHGPKANRLYGTRDQILIDHQFNPDRDLKPDYQGLFQLTNRSPELRRSLQWYFGQRNEDALS